jgi:hypothetical protein
MRGPNARSNPTQKATDLDVQGRRKRNMRQGRRLEKSAFARRDAVRVATDAGEPVIRLCALL